jgi:hypothetical protein
MSVTAGDFLLSLEQSRKHNQLHSKRNIFSISKVAYNRRKTPEKNLMENIPHKEHGAG